MCRRTADRRDTAGWDLGTPLAGKVGLGDGLGEREFWEGEESKERK